MRFCLFTLLAAVSFASPGTAANITCDIKKDGANVAQCVFEPTGLSECRKSPPGFQLRCIAASFSAQDADYMSCEIAGETATFAKLDLNERMSEEDLSKAILANPNYQAVGTTLSARKIKKVLYVGAIGTGSRLSIDCNR